MIVTRGTTKRLQVAVLTLLVSSLATLSAAAQNPEPVPAPQPQEQQQLAPAPVPTEKPVTPPAQAATPPKHPVHYKTPRARAWAMLHEGLADDRTEKRAKTVNALGLLVGNAEAEKAARAALKDGKSMVRLAAAGALGSMHAVHSKDALEDVLDDDEPTVVLAAANSLMLLKDDTAYDVYYAVLTGDKRANKGLVKEQLKTLKDKKKMAQMGFEEGIGFIPFAGIGYEVFRTVTKNDSGQVRAAAAKKLAHDPDPGTSDALVAATTDKNWAVRAAALEALAQRGDRSVVANIAMAMDDDKDVVRLMAAACVAHLTDLRTPKAAATPKKD